MSISRPKQPPRPKLPKDELARAILAEAERIVSDLNHERLRKFRDDVARLCEMVLKNP